MDYLWQTTQNLVDIETEWNLKILLKRSCFMCEESRYRNRMEFKADSVALNFVFAPSRYRNRMEFKATLVNSLKSTVLVDIETEWNLKAAAL